MKHHVASAIARLRIEPGQDAKLAKRKTDDTAFFKDKASGEASLADDARAIDALQDRLYAEGKRALLVVLQGMDTSGKDGTIRAVFRETSPIGVAAAAFKAPTAEELAHDFLWRIHQVCPERGTIRIFNRSHYEDVLAVRVEKLAPPEVVEQRFGMINDFESMLAGNGTTIVKFMLHISKDEQKKRLQARLDDPEKHWKFNPNDLAARKLWEPFQAAYEVALTRCSTAHAPWYVIPSDHKWVRNALVARIVRTTLEAMDPRPADPGWKKGEFTIR
ncbi:MAG TPA: PPK2 family polyphosphate kinase [Hyphomicrobiales bacterium]|nr:PPK2 family polyphosphate kinase [Hyphomicrobiales bacterium]